MKRDRPALPTGNKPPISPPLLTDAEWQHVIVALRLTPQQGRIVALILHGKRDKQIATEMKISVWTVRTHLTRIFDCLGVSDRVELVVRVFVSARDSSASMPGSRKL